MLENFDSECLALQKFMCIGLEEPRVSLLQSFIPRCHPSNMFDLIFLEFRRIFDEYFGGTCLTCLGAGQISVQPLFGPKWKV